MAVYLISACLVGSDMARSALKVWRASWSDYNTQKETILASDMTYDQMVGALSNLVNDLNTKVSLDSRALFNLQMSAINDPFATLPPEEQERLRDRPSAQQLAVQRRVGVEAGREPRFDIGFEQARPTTGPQRWKDWFRSQFSRELGQFQATTELESLGAEQVEESWAEFLKRRRPQLREQFFRQSPFERGERPQVFAQKIKTVGPF